MTRQLKRFLCLASGLFILNAVAPIRSHAAAPAEMIEGGRMDTDFGLLSLGEWWYFNGDLKLVALDGGYRELGFFLTGAHQESRLFQVGGAPASYLNHFRGIYFDDGTNRFDFQYTYVPRETIGDYVALGTPSLRFTYPDRSVELSGSARKGYRLRYDTADVKMNLRYLPASAQTAEDAQAPLRFTAAVRAHGLVHGTVVIDGRTYLAFGSGYFDHMIPLGATRLWGQTFHGWSWAEVTTPRYQAVIYAMRSLSAGYDGGYGYKHLVLIDRRTGRVVAEHSGDAVAITESDWVEEPADRRRRPLTTVYSAGDLRITVHGDRAVHFDTANPAARTGFVDFMAHEQGASTIERGSDVETGDGFWEYLVTEAGLAPPSN